VKNWNLAHRAVTHLGVKPDPSSLGRRRQPLPAGRPRRALGGRTILFLIAASGAIAAGDPGSDAGAQRTDIRRELLSEFKYAPPQKDPSAPPPIVSPVQATQAAEPGADIVVMAPFTVRETVRMEKLHSDLMQEKAEARTAAIMTKLGVGVHVLPAGPMYFYAATIFYIPFAVGGGISF
jgi:hypothetical protein